MIRLPPAIRAPRSKRWLSKKGRYQNPCARDRMTARARAGARTGEKTTARAKEAAQPTEASLINSRSHYPRRHIGGPGAIQRGWDGPGVLSQEIFIGANPFKNKWAG